MYEQIARNRRRSAAYVLAFVAVWLGVGALLGFAWAGIARQPGTGAPVRADVTTGVLVAGLVAAAGVLFSLSSGSRLVLSVAGARPADPVRHRQVLDLVEALSLGVGIPVPAVYVIDDPAPNAFATGLDPGRASVAVTTGLLAVMDREELEGVLAHEVSHIKNYDTRLLLVVATLLGMAGLLASQVWRALFVVRGRGRDAGQLTVLILAAGALLAVVAFVVGPVIRLALSRRRESLADASSVELTRNPTGLLRALRTLQRNDRPLDRTNHATAAMCIDDPLQHHSGRLHRLFDTHPPLEERIAVLERMVQGLTV